MQGSLSNVSSFFLSIQDIKLFIFLDDFKNKRFWWRSRVVFIKRWFWKERITEGVNLQWIYPQSKGKTLYPPWASLLKVSLLKVCPGQLNIWCNVMEICFFHTAAEQKLAGLAFISYISIQARLILQAFVLNRNGCYMKKRLYLTPVVRRLYSFLYCSCQMSRNCNTRHIQ